MGLQANKVSSSALVWTSLRNIKYQLQKRKAVIQYQLGQFLPDLSSDWSIYNSAVGPILDMFGRQTIQLTANPSQSDYQGDGSYNSYVISKDPGLLVGGYNLLATKGLDFSNDYPLEITLAMAKDNPTEYQKRNEYWNSVLSAFAAIKAIENTIGVVYTAGIPLWRTHFDYDKSPGQMFVLAGESAGEFNPVMLGADPFGVGGRYADFNWDAITAYKDAELPGGSLKEILENDGDDYFLISEKQVNGTTPPLAQNTVETVSMGLTGSQAALTVNAAAYNTGGLVKYGEIFQYARQATDRTCFSSQDIYIHHNSIRGYMFEDGAEVDYSYNVVYLEEM